MFKKIFDKLKGLTTKNPPAKRPRLTIAVDFDGVLHSYSSGWQGVGVASDPPVPGAMAWLCAAVNEFDVAIYSSRSASIRGQIAMRRWLQEHLAKERGQEGLDTYDMIRWPVTKPSAFLTIDDRAHCFEGVFPDAKEIRAFKPWNKRQGPMPAPGVVAHGGHQLFGADFPGVVQRAQKFGNAVDLID